MPLVAPPLFIALLAFSPFVTSRSCYSRNGTLITDIAYQPCSSSGESACCGTNHSGAGHKGIANDVCEVNGLCQNYESFDGTNENVKLYWRQGCTDADWSSPNCLANVCDTAEYENDNAPVYSCGDGKWCCGKKSCCSASASLFTLAATVGLQNVVDSVIATSSVTATETAITRSSISSSTTESEPSISGATTFSFSASETNSASPSSSSSPELTGSSSISTSVKAGIAAGVAVFAMLLGIILFLLHKIKKQRANWDKAELPGSSQQLNQKCEAVSYGRVENNPVELPGQAMPQEMNAQRDNLELDTNERVQWTRAAN